jgi:hypothetical protein
MSIQNSSLFKMIEPSAYLTGGVVEETSPAGSVRSIATVNRPSTQIHEVTSTSHLPKVTPGHVRVQTGGAGALALYEDFPQRVSANKGLGYVCPPTGYCYLPVSCLAPEIRGTTPDEAILLGTCEELSGACVATQPPSNDETVHYELVPMTAEGLCPVATQNTGKGPKHEVNYDLLVVANYFNTQRGLEPILKQYRGICPPKVDITTAMRTADNFLRIPDPPYSAAVLAAYDAFCNEIMMQYFYAESHGFRMRPWQGEGRAYSNSKEMSDHCRNDRTVYFDMTAVSLGATGAAHEHQEYPLLRRSGVHIDGQPMTYNDIFRAVHELFGHAMLGTNYGPVGEANAWRIHSFMFTPLANLVLVTELRGQNTFTNYGPHMRDESGNLRRRGDPKFLTVPNRPFAAQKAGFLPVGNDQVREANDAIGDRQCYVQEVHETPEVAPSRPQGTE